MSSLDDSDLLNELKAMLKNLFDQGKNLSPEANRDPVDVDMQREIQLRAQGFSDYSQQLSKVVELSVFNKKMLECKATSSEELEAVTWDQLTKFLDNTYYQGALRKSKFTHYPSGEYAHFMAPIVLSVRTPKLAVSIISSEEGYATSLEQIISGLEVTDNQQTLASLRFKVSHRRQLVGQS